MGTDHHHVRPLTRDQAQQTAELTLRLAKRYVTSGPARSDESAPQLAQDPADRTYGRQRTAVERPVPTAYGEDPEVTTSRSGVVHGSWGGQRTTSPW